MKKRIFNTLGLICLSAFMACSQAKNEEETIEQKESKTNEETAQAEPHRYGGWYCPDNLYGFPATDINKWQDVPVVNGRMATKEDTQNESALIFVDQEKYPNAKPLNIQMPQLASIYNENTNREDIIIIIQALNIDNDSIVGYRFLNGGNGSARLSDVTLINNDEVDLNSASKFVRNEIEIDATQEEVWNILTNVAQLYALQPIFDLNKELDYEWREETNVNYHYPHSGKLRGAYGGFLYGNYYIQNDFDSSHYTEKILLTTDQETNSTTMKIVGGPFTEDYSKQNEIIAAWAEQVKILSEKE